MPSPGGGEWRRPAHPAPSWLSQRRSFLVLPPPPSAPFPASPACLLLCAVNSPGGAPASSSVCGRSPAKALPPAHPPPRVASVRSVFWSRASLWTVSPHPRGWRAGRWGWVVGGPEPPVPGPGGRFRGLRGVLPPESGPGRDGWDRGGGSQDLEVGGRSSRVAAWPGRHGLLSGSKLPGRKPATCEGSLAFLGSGGKA